MANPTGINQYTGKNSPGRKQAASLLMKARKSARAAKKAPGTASGAAHFFAATQFRMMAAKAKAR